MNKLKAIIVDDMELARATLKADIEEYCPNIELIGEADGVVSGTLLIKKSKPDIIFLDIHMTDGEGFDILEILDNLESKVIFTTASEQHAIQAFQVNAIDYLLKPIDPDRLIKAVAKCEENILHDKKESAPYSPIKKSNKISLHTQDDITLIEVEDILHLKSEGNYTFVYDVHGSKTMVSKSIKEFESILKPFGFIRTHQSHLVAINKIKAYLKSAGGFIQLIDNTEIPVSVRKKAEIVKLLGEITL